MNGSILLLTISRRNGNAIQALVKFSIVNDYSVVIFRLPVPNSPLYILLYNKFGIKSSNNHDTSSKTLCNTILLLTSIRFFK